MKWDKILMTDGLRKPQAYPGDMPRIFNTRSGAKDWCSSPHRTAQFRFKATVIALAVLVIFGIGPAGAKEAYYPSYTGYVNDFAGLLTARTKTRLTSLIGELERKTTAQVAVVTVNSIAPETIEGYANKLFERWGIGQKGKDNGVLIVVAIKEEKTRIEVGYGLEGAIPDAKAFAIYKEIMVPNFRAGDFSRGITQATEAIVGLIAEEHGVEIADVPEVPSSIRQATQKSLLGKILGGLFPLLFLLLIFGSRLGLFGWLLLGSGRRRGGFWYGGGMGGNSGGFSGGFGGFGGGMSGGGGAGGGW